MKNKERAVVYSLLALSIFLGLSRPLSTVVADNPPGEATFSKLTIVDPQGKPGIVLDGDVWAGHGGGVLVYGHDGGLRLHIRAPGEGGCSIQTYGAERKKGLTLFTDREAGSSVSIMGPKHKSAILLETSEDGKTHVSIHGPDNQPCVSLAGTPDGRGAVSINHSHGQPGILLECWGQDEERHSKIDMYGSLKDQGPETIMMNGKPVKVARPPSVKLGVSLEAGGWTDNHVITYGLDERFGGVLRTNAGGESSVEVHGVGARLGVEMRAATVQGKGRATSSNGITVFRPSGEQGIRLGVTDDASGLSISSSEKGADVGLAALFDGRGRVYTRKPDGKPGALVETTKDGSSKLEVYSPDGNVTGHLP